MESYSSDLEGRAPLIFEDIKTNSAYRKQLLMSISEMVGDLPSLSMLGWKILVLKRTLGGTMGYSSGR